MDDRADEMRYPDDSVSVESRTSASWREAAPHDTDRQVDLMSRGIQETIAAEMLPRLLLVHRVSPPARRSAALTAGDRARFLHRVVNEDGPSATAYVQELLARGIPATDILVDLLSSTARSLGSLWDEDELSFADVTVGLCTLHQILRNCDWRGDGQMLFDGQGPNVLLATFSGEQHIFGAMIVAEVFRNAGWRVATLAGSPFRDICDALASKAFDVLALSSAHADATGQLAEEITAFRSSSLNPDLSIIVGGQTFNRRPELAHRIGADALITDAETAPTLAAGLHQGPKARS